jgi:hypothetical protein
LKSVTKLTFKHCQEIKGEALSSIGAMTQLRELHFIYNIDEGYDVFETEELVHQQNLKKLKVLTLMYIMIDHYDLLDLEGKQEIGGEYCFKMTCLINSTFHHLIID